MEKWMCYAALGTAAVMLLVFLLDLIVEFPFGGTAFVYVDIFGIIASVVVGYLGYSALRDLK